MMSEYGNAELEVFIMDEVNSIQKYMSKDTASLKYIDLANKKIERLIEINNRILCLNYQEVWEFVEKEMSNMKTIDPHITGFMIEFNVDFSKGNIASIKIPSIF